MTEIKSQLQQIHHQIAVAADKAGRPATAVRLLAVSKTWPAARLREAAAAGQRLFGENYLQEALDKMQALDDLDLEWHFIGPIQSNKTRDIAAHFDWAQSVDRLKIARRLNEQRPAALSPLNVCLQVNIDQEASKSGCEPEQVMTLAGEIMSLTRLRLRGLMIIPAHTTDRQQQLATFARAHALYAKLQADFSTVDTLSMGMSGDMSAAIEAGSTMVRVGTALFGQRASSQG